MLLCSKLTMPVKVWWTIRQQKDKQSTTINFQTNRYSVGPTVWRTNDICLRTFTLDEPLHAKLLASYAVGGLPRSHQHWRVTLLHNFIHCLWIHNSHGVTTKVPLVGAGRTLFHASFFPYSDNIEFKSMGPGIADMVGIGDKRVSKAYPGLQS